MAEMSPRPKLEAELVRIKQAIAGQEASRGILPDEQIEIALALLRGRLAELEIELQGGGVIAQGPFRGDNTTTVGERGINVSGSIGGNVISGDQNLITVVAESGSTVYVGEIAPVKIDAVDRESALGHYLAHVIAHNRYLQLHGIRSSNLSVHIELEHIYITLRAHQKRTVQAEASWIFAEGKLAPGERQRVRYGQETIAETMIITVNEALNEHQRLVILGDPGSGKTTLLRYLALVYARDMAEKGGWIEPKLSLSESGLLPILLPLRKIGAYLRGKSEDGTEGHAHLLQFLHQSLANERVRIPDDFFDEYLGNGCAIILLDGIDEVTRGDLRRRVVRLIESFASAYPDCRFVITSRIKGYTNIALGENCVTTIIRDFALDDVEQFLRHWHRLGAIIKLGAGENAEHLASIQTQQLMATIRGNERIQELAINPLMLTVIALVHRDWVKLPDRRAELYAEAVDVLLGKWDEARGVTEQHILENIPFDIGDKRLILQNIALYMHEQGQKEIELSNLRPLLFNTFHEIAHDKYVAERAADRFLQVIEERTGLLAARGDGVYAFSHLTFQEYLAALAIAARDDYITKTLDHVPDSWWREVILLEAGHLSMLGKERTTHLIRAIAELKQEPEPYYNIVLAAECLRDVGRSRVKRDVEEIVQQRLHKGLESPPPLSSLLSRWLGGEDRNRDPKQWIEQRAIVVNAILRAGAGYWTKPYGEPEWIEIPAGEFVMGNDEYKDETPLNQSPLDTFCMARVPITNAQYYFFVKDTGVAPPRLWKDGNPPQGWELHPVTDVTWYDAMAYCRWLSQMTGKTITLPSEAEWEKAARGDDGRTYPWGNKFDPMRCNTRELGIGSTTPIGVFPNGASPYGVLDMCGNVWEWTLSIYRAYGSGYNTQIFDEDLESQEWRAIRGGAFYSSPTDCCCTSRSLKLPDFSFRYYGFRVALYFPVN